MVGFSRDASMELWLYLYLLIDPIKQQPFLYVDIPVPWIRDGFCKLTLHETNSKFAPENGAKS